MNAVRSINPAVPATAETILASVTDGFFALDASWRFTYVNRQAERLIRHRAADVLGSSIWELFPGPIGMPIRVAFDRARTSHTAVSLETFCPTLRSWFAVTAYPTEQDGLAIYFRDVTSQKQTELALRESEERFRVTFEQAPVGIAHVDPAGRWLRVNQRLCDLLGYTRGELRAQRFQDVSYRSDLGLDLKQMGQMLRGEIDAYDTEKRYLRKQGGLIWCHVHVSLVRAADQTPKYFIVIFEDISARKEADAVLGAVAHELRLPLGHIKGFVSTLRAPDTLLDAATRDDFLSEIEREVERLAHLIEDLLDRADASRDGAEPRRTRTTPIALVHASLARVRAELGNRPVQVDLPADLPPVVVDVPAMERVLANLLHNASKYSPPGTPIEISARVVGGVLELHVDDHGPGVPVGDAERIFEPFYRHVSTVQPRQPGHGLGLAICRSIVAAHGGRIWTVARPGGGGRFTVSLPVHAGANRSASAARARSGRAQA